MDMNQITAEIAYSDGYDAGKQAAAEEILEELEENFTELLDSFNRLQKEHVLVQALKHDPEYWNGRAMTCREILRTVSNFKKRYGVK